MNSRVIPVTTLAALTLFLGSAQAGPREDVLEALGKCAAVTPDHDRLACYDALAPRLRDALNTPPETLSHPPTKEEQESWFGFDLGNIFGSTKPEAQTTPQQFGADNLPKTAAPVAGAAAGAAADAGAAAPAAPVVAQEPQEIDSISANLTEYSLNPFGKFIVFLDNGQVWREADSENNVAHFSKPASTNSVRIERASLGGYSMYINGSSKTFKVTRIK